MKYLYETHLHTSQSSACGVSPGREYIRRYKDLGYTGIIVTDHFYRGNTAVDLSLPWKKWVDRFCRGFEDAREEGARQGLDVFFGWEETFDGDDYLVYGLDRQWLLEHPEASHWTRTKQYQGVHFFGGCVVQAHPFRQHYYINRICLSPCCVDAVEAANGGNREPSYDALAKKYANKLGLPITAGSDIHNTEDVRETNTFGIYLDKRMETIADYVEALKGGTIAGLRMSPGRCDYRGDERITLPVDILDKNSRPTGQDLGEFFAS
ncbi:MAG: PHP domain-containing protein [Treponema sp.]|jgi:hypothetical protein|nr:PHP domain-containing protein [Treponema sp.]